MTFYVEICFFPDSIPNPTFCCSFSCFLFYSWPYTHSWTWLFFWSYSYICLCNWSSHYYSPVQFCTLLLIPFLFCSSSCFLSLLYFSFTFSCFFCILPLFFFLYLLPFQFLFMFLHSFSYSSSFSCSFSSLYSSSSSCSCAGSYLLPSVPATPVVMFLLPSFQSFNISWARIHKPFKEPRNRLPAWRPGTTTLYDVPARQATWAAELIPGLLKRLQIRALKLLFLEITVPTCTRVCSELLPTCCRYPHWFVCVSLLSIPLLQSQIKYGTRKKKEKRKNAPLKMRQVIFFERLPSSIF